MRLAITADLHFRDAHPERFAYFRSLLEQLEAEGTDTLLVAGDCLDKDFHAYASFDAVAREYSDIQFWLIPGNHDPQLRGELFGAGNIEVFNKPSLWQGDGMPLVFLPYQQGQAMGEVLARQPFIDDLEPGNWILVSHGDFGSGWRRYNGGESGYFPLGRDALTRLQPRLVVLGHIHKSGEPDPGVLYPGTPWPLDHTETGQRSFLIVENGNASVRRIRLTGNPVYYQLDLVVLPGDDEWIGVEQQLKEFINTSRENYQGENYAAQARFRIRLQGFSRSRSGWEDRIGDWFSDAALKMESIDIQNLRFTDNPELSELASRVRDRTGSIVIDDEMEGLREKILEEALMVIFDSGK